MSASAPAFTAQLAFTRAQDVSLAAQGGLRSRTLGSDEASDPRSYDQRECRLFDSSGEPLDLRVHGFAHADLSRRFGLLRVLERVRTAGRIADTDAAEIRRHLLGRSLPLSAGGRLRILYLAREGFFMRRAGPNGRRADGDGRSAGMNGHDAAMAVHADQDVDGTPLRQILRGAAPWLFHHDSPDRHNRWSRLHLVNLWIPLDQVTRPLALMDTRTLDRRAHQLRHGLPTDTFLRRREDMRVNDIWTFLHADGQRWYFTPEMDARTAYVFETLGTPHGSFIVPGEAIAEALHLRLLAAVDAVRRRDQPALVRALASPDAERRQEPATAPLRRAIAAMDRLLAEGRADLGALCQGNDPSSWCARATAAADRVVRKSLEMRAVALVTPGPIRRGPR